MKMNEKFDYKFLFFDTKKNKKLERHFFRKIDKEAIQLGLNIQAESKHLILLEIQKSKNNISIFNEIFDTIWTNNEKLI